MTSVVDLLAARKPHEQTARVALRNDLTHEISRLEGQLVGVELGDTNENRIPEAPTIRARLAVLRAEAEAGVVEILFRELGRATYETLIRANPPRPQDVANDAQWNTDTFPPALMAISAVPPMTLADATRLWDELPFGEARTLFLTAVHAQAKVGAVPLPTTGTGTTAATGQKSTTPPPAESPEASS